MRKHKSNSRCAQGGGCLAEEATILRIGRVRWPFCFHIANTNCRWKFVPVSGFRSSKLHQPRYKNPANFAVNVGKWGKSRYSPVRFPFFVIFLPVTLFCACDQSHFAYAALRYSHQRPCHPAILPPFLRGILFVCRPRPTSPPLSNPSAPLCLLIKMQNALACRVGARLEFMGRSTLLILCVDVSSA